MSLKKSNFICKVHGEIPDDRVSTYNQKRNGKIDIRKKCKDCHASYQRNRPNPNRKHPELKGLTLSERTKVTKPWEHSVFWQQGNIRSEEYSENLIQELGYDVNV